MQALDAVEEKLRQFSSPSNSESATNEKELQREALESQLRTAQVNVQKIQRTMTCANQYFKESNRKLLCFEKEGMKKHQAAAALFDLLGGELTNTQQQIDLRTNHVRKYFFLSLVMQIYT